MAIAPFLALNSRAAATPQLRRYINATPSNVGATFGTADTEPTSLNNPRGYPAVVKFGGAQTFLATVGNEIYRSEDGAVSWTLVKTFTAATHIATTNTAAKSGLFVMHVAGVATAVVITKLNASANYFSHTSTDGVIWVTSAAFVGPSTVYSRSDDSVLWNGKLVTIWLDGTAVTDNALTSVFDPSIGTMTFALFGTLGNGNSTGAALCVYNSRVFGVVRGTAGANATVLRELVAGTWGATIGTSLAASAAGAVNEGKFCMFVDGVNMYAFVTSAAAWKCFRWDSVLTRTDISATIIPTALATLMVGAARMSVVIDNRAVPGTTPTIWLYQSVDGSAASAVNEWQWNGDINPSNSFIGTTPTAISSAPQDSGGSARDNLPFVKHAQGTTYWTSGEDHVELKGFAPTLGGIIVSYKLYNGNKTEIAVASNGAILPQGTINVDSTTGFAASGTLYVQTSTGTQTVAYTGVTATSFTGCTGGTGTMSTFGIVTAATTGSIRAWRGVSDDEYPLTAATLSGTTSALAIDDFTTRVITWQAQTDGFATGQLAKFAMEKF
jgi:hypothetical protein